MAIENRYTFDPFTQDDQGTDIFLKKETWKRYFAEEAELELKYLNVEENVEILLVKAIPPVIGDLKPVLFIAGWFSQIPAWVEMLHNLSKQTTVYYIETREKTSSRLTGKDIDFSISRMALDFAEFVKQFEERIEDTIVIASSLGATFMINYTAHFERVPLLTIMIGPNPRIKLPPVIGPFLYRMPLFMFKGTLAYVRWHIIKFRSDPDKDPDQVLKYLQVLRLAIPWRLRKSASQVVKYNGWEELPKMKGKVVFVGSKADKLHGVEQTLKMKDLSRDAYYLEFETNRDSHSEAMADIVSKICAGDTSMLV